MNIDTQQMKTFITVVREQNFRRAAKLLNVSQPTVTLRIKALEQDLGSQLIKRNDNQLTLTPSGELVLKYVEKMLFVLQDVKDHLSSIPLTNSRYSIAAIPSFCTYAFPTLLKDENIARQSQFTIQNVPSMKVLQLVSDGAVDFGIMRGPLNSDSNVNSRLLYTEKIYLAMPKNHPLVEKEKIYIQDILKEKIITFKRRFWSFFANSILELGENFEQNMVVDSEITAKKFVASGLGVTLLAKMTMKDSDLEHITLKGIEDFKISRNAFLVYRNDQNEERIDEFYRWVKISLANEKGSDVIQ